MSKIIDLHEARQILGVVAESMTDEDVQKLISTFQVLCEAWLDQHEIEVLGRTIKEINERYD